MKKFQKKYNNRSNILITGASDGIGKGLAIFYAQSGAHLYLLARNQQKLEQVKSICEANGACVTIFVCDVADDQKLTEFFKNIENLDLVIANAGISGGTAKGYEGVSQSKKIFETNIIGISNTVELAIPKMTDNSHIAVMSSLAGFIPMPSAPSYSSSKAAVRYYGLALRRLLSPKIKVTVICPGFVDTNMTRQNKFIMPLLMNVDQAVKIITNRLRSGPRIIAFPSITAWSLMFLAIMPNFIIEFITKLLPKK